MLTIESSFGHPGQLTPVLRSFDGARQLVVCVELARDIQAGRTFKYRRAICFDMHDSGRAPVWVDTLEPLSAPLSGGHVQVDEVVGDSVLRVSLAL